MTAEAAIPAKIQLHAVSRADGSSPETQWVHMVMQHKNHADKLVNQLMLTNL